jgi:hypothetical protein
MSSFNFTNLVRHLANADIDWDTATFKVLLVSSIPTITDTTGNQDTWDARSSVTNEITGTGYTAGGIAQAFTLNALTLVGGKQTITWTNITNGWTSATFSAVGAIIYLNSGSAATDWLLHFVDFGGTVSCTAGNFSITYSTTFDITA